MSRRLPNTLPQHLAVQFAERREAIQARLRDFASVPASQHFYELCYCLCTPQSKAVHADAVVQALMQGRFLEEGWDPTPLLRDPAHYIRFHRTKGARLLALRAQWDVLGPILRSPMPPDQLREILVREVSGFGMKEASHALRNIGKRGLAIIDRHLITNLVACGVYARPPVLGSIKRYLAVERRFKAYASAVGIDMDELDLLFWSDQAGLILK